MDLFCSGHFTNEHPHWQEARFQLLFEHEDFLCKVRRCLYKGTAELKLHCANVVNHCVSLHQEGDSKRLKLKQMMLQAGIVTALCECCQGGTSSVSPQAQAAGALANLMYGSVDVQNCCLQNGLLEAASQMSENPNSLSFEKGIWCLKGLVFEHTVTVPTPGFVATQIAELGVLDKLHKCFAESRDLNAVCQAADLLADMATHGFGQGAQRATGLPRSEQVAQAIVKMVPVLLPLLTDALGSRAVEVYNHKGESRTAMVGAAGSIARVLYQLASCATTAEQVASMGTAKVVADQLKSGPLIRPRLYGFCVEWLSGILHALCLHPKSIFAVAAEFASDVGNAADAEEESDQSIAAAQRSLEEAYAEFRSNPSREAKDNVLAARRVLEFNVLCSKASCDCEFKETAILQAEAKVLHAAADVNRDGILSKNELKKQIQKDLAMRARLVTGSWREFFAVLDKDGDGNISCEELVTFYVRKLSRCEHGNTSFVEAADPMDAEHETARVFTKHAIEAALRATVAKKPESVLLSWAVHSKWIAEHLKLLQLPKKRGKDKCFLAQIV